jgi:hypothetical protein
MHDPNEVAGEQWYSVDLPARKSANATRAQGAFDRLSWIPSVILIPVQVANA